MSLALMDLRDTPGHSVADDYTKQTHFGLLLAMLRGLRILQYRRLLSGSRL
jgi:hypothetical protein